MGHTEDYLSEATQIIAKLDRDAIAKVIRMLGEVRDQGGRLFILGVGGSAGNASHAVNDFRKIAGIEAYAPTDNVSELTARVNDDGWDTAFSSWLKVSRLSDSDVIFVLSVGGGSLENNVSVNLVRALELAQEVGAGICGIVGREDGYTAQVADACVVVSTKGPTLTALAESFQALVWHLIVSHPDIQRDEMKWESVDRVSRS